MPVLPVYRDPVLISIDRQRLNDLGIPAEPGHECLSTFYGAFGVITPVLIVPEGWQDALPDGEPEVEWNMAEWEAAENDSADERPEHSRHISLHDAIATGAILGAVAWLISDAPGLIQHFYALSENGGLGRSGDPVLIESLTRAIYPIALGAGAGATAPVLSRLFRNRRSFHLLACLFFFVYYIAPFGYAVFMILSAERSK